MITWAKSFSLLVMVALEVIRYLQRRADYNKAKLIEAANLLTRANDLINTAQLASSRVDDTLGAVLSDPDNRDERSSGSGANGLDTSATSLQLDVQNKVQRDE